jgi:hypothetical protein
MNTKENNGAILTGSSQRQIALVAGFGLLLMTVSILLADALALNNLIVPGNAAATANNIISNESQFRFGVFCYLIVIILDLIVAWAFYVFLKPLNDSLSLLAAWSRLVYTTIFGIALVNYYSVVQLLSNADYLSAFETTDLHAQVRLSLKAFRDGWDVGFVFFGLHLAFLGYVLFKSSSIPKWLGILVFIGGVSYLIDYCGQILLVNFNPIASMIFGWGEAIFMLWLIFRGGKQKKSAAV